MNTKHYFIISGIIGGVIGSLLTAMLISPVTADREKFGEIGCTSLKVVDAEGSTLALVSGGDRGGLVQVFDTESQAVVHLHVEAVGTVECRQLEVVDGDGKRRVSVSDGFFGGLVNVYDNDEISRAELSVFPVVDAPSP